jgi:hypothetical protein
VEKLATEKSIATNLPTGRQVSQSKTDNIRTATNAPIKRLPRSQSVLVFDQNHFTASTAAFSIATLPGYTSNALAKQSMAALIAAAFKT